MNSELLQSLLTVAGIGLGVAALYWVCQRFMKPFHNRAFICLASLLIGGWVASGAVARYVRGDGGFKLGVDLVGGTILVYEVDVDKLRETSGEKAVADFDPVKMVEFLKKRIDPNDLYNVTIRPVGGKFRYEIILPTGGQHQANIKQKAWAELLKSVQDNPAWKDALTENDVQVQPDRDKELIFRIKQALDKKSWGAALESFKTKFAEKLKDKPDIKLDGIAPGNIIAVVEAIKTANIPTDDVKKFFDEAYKPTGEDGIKKFINEKYAFGGTAKRDFSSELIEETKALITRQGSLEFRIAANEMDDKRGIDAASAALLDPANKADLESRARRGLAPPAIPAQKDDPTGFSYNWVELDKAERLSLGLTSTQLATLMQLPAEQKQTIFKNFDAGKLSPQEVREYLPLILARARDEGKVVIAPFTIKDSKKNRDGTSSMVFFSRATTNEQIPADERFKKAFDYFILLRDPVKDEAITGENLRADVDDFNQSVNFTHDSIRGRLFGKLTQANQPSAYNDGASYYYRYLAIILDGKVVSAPYLSSVITDSGQIEMKNSPREDRVRLVKTLRAGALPAPLKSIPVSEQTTGSNLGSDTIYKGLLSVGLAFAAVMVFMVIYYEFAGIVACIALMANLVLTIAFMVFVNATFTLPGLAGLVLMLGMAVDANVLIYERIREEKDRGASLSLALRNGYERAFPTIIDTHLTSFFTAIVLYAVGNDQLRGFGISLASGLVISLFTSLYMTRLIFDVWQYKGWLKKLEMRRFFTKTNIDFMGIRNYLFAFTLALTVVGLAVFLLRGEQGRAIDFVGGTAYGGQLKQSIDIGTLRNHLKNQNERLAVASVEQVDDSGKSFRVTFKNFGDKVSQVEFVEPVLGASATKQAREEEVKRRASHLPDWTVVQTFVSGDTEAKSGESRFFTVRSVEKEADLVQVAVARLLATGKDGKTLEPLLRSSPLDKYDVKGKVVTLEFKEGASPAYLKSFLERQFKQNGFGEQAFDLRGEGRSENSRYKTMTLEITTAAFDPVRDRAKLDQILQQTTNDFADRPQPERLEKFDAQIAAETSGRALYAILASWLVIMLFLWFRCGSWTFGLAAVLCLVHDLCFTLGAIAFCHYLVEWAPGLASFLLIDDFKIDLTAVAALLTLVGYSVNDTIVVFDRIREVRGKSPELTFKMINDSVNQTLSRTLLASATVFLVVSVLYLFGGESLRLFAFVMVMGVIVGTYSSIYVASPLLIMLGEGKQPNRGSAKTAEKSITA